jgi:hypothetical protein
MTKLEYKKYLKTEHWLELKKRMWSSNVPKVCFACGIGNCKLAIHHRTYTRIGREKISDLVFICDGCHKKIHEYKKKFPRKDLIKITRMISRRIRKREPRVSQSSYQDIYFLILV